MSRSSPIEGPVKNMFHKIAVGVAIAVTAGGIMAVSNLLMNTNANTTQIKQQVDDMSSDFDRFVEIRYQEDMRRIDEAITRVNDRVDDALSGS